MDVLCSLLPEIERDSDGKVIFPQGCGAGVPTSTSASGLSGAAVRSEYRLTKHEALTPECFCSPRDLARSRNCPPPFSWPLDLGGVFLAVEWLRGAAAVPPFFVDN